MTKRQRAFHKASATMMLCIGLLALFGMIGLLVHLDHDQKNARSLGVIFGVVSLACGMWVFICWKTKSVVIRSVEIERKSEPDSYWRAMLGYSIITLAFVVAMIWELYVSFRHAA
jgi:hypothetical protein